MTKRLSAGVLLAACAVLFTAVSALAERPPTREWRGGEDPYASKLPLFFRSSVGTTWVNVGQACSASDTTDSNHSPAQVWCFDKAAGDSTWPSRGAQGAGNWNHWSKFAPPIPPGSKWHVTTRHPGASARSAWCGCDSLGTNPACNDIAFWAFKEGYGDDWNFALTLAMDGFNASTGGTIKFDIRYDSECNYDYTYLEYFRTSDNTWQQVVDGGSKPALFNSVSGNTCTGHGGTGRCCGDDYFFHSDQKNLGSGNVNYYGNSTWMTNVTFPMPAQAGGMRLRWRCFSDGAWSDADGNGDTDGIAAIDNVLVTFASTGHTVSDGFEDNAFTPDDTNPGSNATWTPGGLIGETFDGWHLEFDPKYKNKGNTCDFSNDWMWSARPVAGFPTNGWSYYLVSPKINCNGWTGGVMEYANYLCAQDAVNDYTNTHIRFYNANTNSWSLWNDFDGFIIFGGCEFWNMNDTELLTPYLGSEVDSLQLAWEMLDIDQAGDFEWGLHGSVAFLVDNVSVGHFDGSASIFTARTIDIFGDTFSRGDPMHTPFLQNAEEGNWLGNAGTRVFSSSDSIGVQIDDVDGITASNVRIHWRVGTGTPPSFGAWSNKLMVYSDPSPTSPTDEGTYRSAIGNTTTEDANPGQEAGSVPGNPAMDPIFAAGQTIEYYLKVTDNAANVAVFPGTADDTPTPAYFRVQILPFNRLAGTK